MLSRPDNHESECREKLRGMGREYVNNVIKNFTMDHPKLLILVGRFIPGQNIAACCGNYIFKW